MSPTAPIRSAVFDKIHSLGADLVRYLHWDPFALSYPEPSPPSCTNASTPAKMVLRFTDGYDSGIFTHEAINITSEAACKALCLANAECVALTWVVRPLEPCNLYTSITDHKQVLPGCDFWVKVGANSSTSWDFRDIDPYVLSYMNATQGHDALINFSPIPGWLAEQHGQPGFGVRVGEYFSRIISWYTKGGFEDECGTHHSSDHQ